VPRHFSALFDLSGNRKEFRPYVPEFSLMRFEEYMTLVKARAGNAIMLLSLALLLLAGCQPATKSATGNTPKLPAKPSPQAASGQPGATNSGTPTADGVALPESVLASPIRTIDGKTIKLADFKGQVVVVNLWATWCGPCRQEMPDLVAMRKQFKDKGFEIIGVTHVSNDPEPEAVKEFVKVFKIPYPIGYAEANLIYGLQFDGVKGNIPQTFVVSRTGQLLKRFVGFSPVYQDMMRQVVEQALNEKGEGQKAE
jgi:thiol-disulfide isomerase/thioredoxin